MFHMLLLLKYFSNYTDREGMKTLFSMGSIGFLDIVSFLKSDADSLFIYVLYIELNILFSGAIFQKSVFRVIPLWIYLSGRLLRVHLNVCVAFEFSQSYSEFHLFD